MARKKRKRTIKRRASKARARRRSGISVSELGGKRRSRRRSPRKYGAMTVGGGGLETWKRAATASILLRLMRSGAKWAIAKSGINFPALSLAVPAGVAFAASRKMIDIPGLFPMAVDHTVNAVIDYFPALKKAMDFDFGDTKPTKGYSQAMGAITPRSYRDTMRAIEARNGLTITDRPMNFNGLQKTSSQQSYSGYTQD